MRSRVDLPQPEGPSSTRNSPISRPAGENASSTSRLMSFKASMRSPCGDMNVRLTFRMAILYFLVSMGHRGLAMMSCSHGCRSLRCRLRSLLPREKDSFHEREQRAEEKRRYPDGDNARINQVRPVKLFGRLNHGAHAAIAIDDFRQDHVGPTNVIENAEGRKNSG